MIKIVHGSVLDQKVDAIVNAANHTLLGGGGVDGAIHRAAGPRLLEACRKLGGCETGEAKLTDAYDIVGVRHVIHTVGPVWSSKRAQECARLLESCYTHSCQLALAAQDGSIAFPAISCGVYGYPLEDAVELSLEALRPFAASFERIILAMFRTDEYECACAVAQAYAPCHPDKNEGGLIVDL